MNQDRTLTVRQAAEELGLSIGTIRVWIRQRKIGYIRLGGAIRIPGGEIRRLLERGLVPAVRPGDQHV